MKRLFLSLKNSSFLLMITFIVIVVFCFMALVFLSRPSQIEQAQAQVNTYYVCPNGSCDFTHPQDAANAVGPGDTVIVKDGTYTDTDNDDFVLQISTSGNENAWITFKSENKWGAILDGNNYTTKKGVQIDDGSNYIRIEDFEIKETDSGGITINDIDCDLDGFTGTTHHLEFIGNKIHHIAQICDCTQWGNDAIGAGVCTEYITVKNNVIYNIGRLQENDSSCPAGYGTSSGTAADPDCDSAVVSVHDHGLYMDGDNYEVINNIFYNMEAGWAIQLTGAYEEPYQYDGNSLDCNAGECKADYWNIIGNTFDTYNPSKSGQLLLWQGKGAVENIQIKNNIFYQPKNTGIVSYKWGSCNEGTSGHYCCQGLSDIEATNNLVTTSDVSLDCSGITQLNNIIGEDPLFEDANNHDYRLKSDSPAIDAGVDVDLDYDIDGNTRPQGAGYDMGAYEYQPAQAQTCPPSDLNCDSTTDSQDLTSLKSLWGQTGKTDLNQNNITDVSDLGIMMAGWSN